jgi:hypothetical protein
MWCSCYGEQLLGKAREEAAPSIDASPTREMNSEAIAATFDIVANDFVDDWRNVYEYEIMDGGVVLQKYIAFDAEEIIVPIRIDNYPVVTIGTNAFKNCKAMKKISLPASIGTIGYYAFANCTFENIELPYNLREIGSYAFYNCALASIAIPPAVESLGTASFESCKSLKQVVLPKALKTIEQEAFQKCVELSCVDIPEGTVEIKRFVFNGCQKLQKIRIPNSVVLLGSSYDSPTETIFGPYSEIPALTVYCNIGSEALKYARKHDIKIDKYENYRED